VPLRNALRKGAQNTGGSIAKQAGRLATMLAAQGIYRYIDCIFQ
jgi:hypothetical protein